MCVTNAAVDHTQTATASTTTASVGPHATRCVVARPSTVTETLAAAQGGTVALAHDPNASMGATLAPSRTANSVASANADASPSLHVPTTARLMAHARPCTRASESVPPHVVTVTDVEVAIRDAIQTAKTTRAHARAAQTVRMHLPLTLPIQRRGPHNRDSRHRIVLALPSATLRRRQSEKSAGTASDNVV